MALQKEMQLHNGTVANYHRIDKILVTKKSDDAFAVSICIQSYVNRFYRQQGHSINSTSYNYEFSLSDFNHSLFETLYSKLKLEERFQNAIDV